MDATGNLLIQFGDPLGFDRVGDGLVATSAARGAELHATSPHPSHRCAVTRALRGSWIAQIEVLATATGAAQFAIGVRRAPERKTLSQKRPVNAERPQDHAPAAVCDVHVDRNGGVWRGSASVGQLTALNMRTKLLLAYDAASATLLLRAGVSQVSVNDVSGPLQLVAGISTTSSRLRLVGDVDQLPRIPGRRPAGVWGRAATFGALDPDTGIAWPGLIEAGAEPTYEIDAVYPMMGRGGRSRGGIGDIVLINAQTAQGGSGELDDWLNWSARDEPVTIYVEQKIGAASRRVKAARGLVDRIASSGEGRIAITCVDPGAALDAPWQSELYPDNHPVESLRGKRLPTVTGRCRAAPLVPIDPARLEYELCDDICHAYPDAVYDRGVQLTPGAGYSVSQRGRRLTRLTNPAGLQCADVSGGWIDEAVCIGATSGDFVQWSGSGPSPRGWQNRSVRSGGGSAWVNQHANGKGARFYRSYGGVAELVAYSALPAGSALLRIDIDIVSISGGPLRILSIGASNSSQFELARISSAGEASLVVTNNPGRTHIALRLDADGDVRIRSLRIAQVSQVRHLAEHLRHALVCRAGLPESVMHPSVAQGNHALMRSDMCLSTGPDDRRTVRSVVDELMSSVNGAWWFDANGQLRIALQRAPELLAPELALNDANIIGEIRVERDGAPGLSRVAASDPTWALHGESDIAESLRTTPAGRARAAALTQSHAHRKQLPGALADDYAHADAAAPIETLFAAATTGAYWLLTSIRLCYQRPRSIYRVTAALDSPHELQPGACVVLDHAGVQRKLIVIGARGRYASHLVDLTLWG